MDLCGFIIVYILLMIFSPSILTFNILSIGVIILFVFITLSDTSRIVLTGGGGECQQHSCTNYPLESTSLILDYVNILVNAMNIR